MRTTVHELPVDLTAPAEQHSNSDKGLDKHIRSSGHGRLCNPSNDIIQINSLRIYIHNSINVMAPYGSS